LNWLQKHQPMSATASTRSRSSLKTQSESQLLPPLLVVRKRSEKVFQISLCNMFFKECVPARALPSFLFPILVAGPFAQTTARSYRCFHNATVPPPQHSIAGLGQQPAKKAKCLVHLQLQRIRQLLPSKNKEGDQLTSSWTCLWRRSSTMSQKRRRR